MTKKRERCSGWQPIDRQQSRQTSLRPIPSAGRTVYSSAAFKLAEVLQEPHGTPLGSFLEDILSKLAPREPTHHLSDRRRAKDPCHQMDNSPKQKSRTSKKVRKVELAAPDIPSWTLERLHAVVDGSRSPL